MGTDVHLVPPCSCPHFVSASCQGEKCNVCAQLEIPILRDATHKVGEEILFDDPQQIRHNLTAYVCCSCFRNIMGPAVPCRNEVPK